jgi:hypothetical protein
MKAVAVVGLGLFVTCIVAVMAGCHHRHEVIVEREGPPPPREVVVEEAPPEAVVVQEAPPPVVVETPGPAPEVGVVWVGGFYSYHDHHYFWVHGRWGRPPYRGAHWEAHRWVHERGGYHYHPGGWHR